MQTLRIAMAQINPVVGDIQGNTDKIKNYIKQAQKENVDVITFPELALTGYPPEDLLFKTHFIIDFKKHLEVVTKVFNFLNGKKGKITNDFMKQELSKINK